MYLFQVFQDLAAQLIWLERLADEIIHAASHDLIDDLIFWRGRHSDNRDILEMLAVMDFLSGYYAGCTSNWLSQERDTGTHWF